MVDLCTYKALFQFAANHLIVTREFIQQEVRKYFVKNSWSISLPWAGWVNFSGHFNQFFSGKYHVDLPMVNTTSNNPVPTSNVRSKRTEIKYRGQVA